MSEEYDLTSAGETVAELLEKNRRLQQAVDDVWAIVRNGVYQGFDYSDKMTRIRLIVEKERTGGSR